MALPKEVSAVQAASDPQLKVGGKLQIRQAFQGDLKDVLELYGQLELNDTEVLPVEQAERIFAKMQLYPDYKVYVAEISGHIVGTFALAVMDNLAHAGKPSGLLEDVVVSAGYQGKGIGHSMMNFAIGYCQEQGCYKVALSSNLAREGAYAFYERLGFRKHGYSFYVELNE